MKCIVYIHVNKINAKCYVGWTVIKDCESPELALERRWREHCSDARQMSRFLFHRAIRKYRNDIWDHEILEVMSTVQGAKSAEILWIAHRRTFAFDEKSLGYNMTRGGDGAVGFKHNEETRAKMSAAKRGKLGNHRQSHSEETKRKIRASVMLITDKTRQKMRDNHVGRSIAVIQCTCECIDIQMFPTMIEAAHAVNGDVRGIRSVLDTKCTYRGFSWKRSVSKSPNEVT